MSELKHFVIGIGKNLETDKPILIATDNEGNARLLNGEVYFKSEVDKEISDLKRLNHDLCERVTENDEIRQHWEEIEQTMAENAMLKTKLAEQDAEIAQLQAMLEERNSQITKLTQSLEQVKRAARTLRKKMNHWKRKFCEAMARERGIAAQMQHDFSMRYENPLYVKRAEWCEKWRDIWKSLVDKFKEAK